MANKTDLSETQNGVGKIKGWWETGTDGRLVWERDMWLIFV